MEQFKEELSRENRTIQTVATYLQDYIDTHWQETFQHGRAEFQRIYETAGDPAYGAYARALFRPLEEQLKQLGISCDSGLPGSFPQSIEQGPMHERERRFWSVLRQDQGQVLGTIVTRYFHDHTQLRIPQKPIMLALEETNPDAINQIITHL